MKKKIKWKQFKSQKSSIFQIKEENSQIFQKIKIKKEFKIIFKMNKKIRGKKWKSILKQLFNLAKIAMKTTTVIHNK